MRESFGGTMMITILMVFIVMFVSFTAVIVNVAKTFRIKNAVISYLENYNYDGTETEGGAISKIDTYLGNSGYIISPGSTLWNEAKAKCEASSDSDDPDWHDKGYCISPQGQGDKQYYRVTVYVYIELPFFDYHLSLPISGETMTFYDLA